MDTPKSLRSHRSQRNLDMVLARAQYFALVLAQLALENAMRTRGD